ncbi:fluoride efflux transporter CrcB [Candidatus Woesearchaeota archaeon]|nr:fluoride efflux transporter CrcB [Candidatus Woesearchaeota archaeon]
MNLVLLVGMGGFIGAILRSLLSSLVQKSSFSFPFGTLTVNVLGSLILGIIMCLPEAKGLFPGESRLFLTMGLIGAFTTMSTFSYESFHLLEEKEIVLFTLYVIGTMALTILAVYLGRVIVFWLK